MRDRQKWATTIGSVILLFMMVSTAASAQKSAAKKTEPADTTTAADASSIGETHKQLMELLRTDRKVSAFISRDPQLLADRDFIGRNNPQLAAFLDAHPEVTKNPEYYLFADLGDRRDNDRLRMGREDWSDVNQPSVVRDAVEFVGPFLIFICLLLAALWLVRTLIESRRWSRLLHVQTDAQNKLLDKFGNSEQLLEYLRSDVDKRLLPPIGVQLALNGHSISNPIARILGPLQAGLILGIVGIGFLSLRSYGLGDAQEVFTPIGMVVMTLGIGLIIAAAAGWILAWHFHMLPDRSAAVDAARNS